MLSPPVLVCFAVMGLVIITVVSYLSLDDLLSATSIYTWCIRSWTHPIGSFLFLWVVYDLFYLALGVPLGAHGPSRPNAMNLLGFGGGNIVRFIASMVGFSITLYHRKEVDWKVVGFLLLCFIPFIGFFFAGGVAYPRNSAFRMINLFINQTNSRLLSLTKTYPVSTWRAILLGVFGTSFLPYAFLVKNNKSLKTVVLIPALLIWARFLTRICDPRIGTSSVALKFMPNLEGVFLISLIPRLLVVVIFLVMEWRRKQVSA